MRNSGSYKPNSEREVAIQQALDAVRQTALDIADSESYLSGIRWALRCNSKGTTGRSMAGSRKNTTMDLFG
jgi:tRNA uridine 5-carbamoylmethylation protein Kti12